MPLNKGTVLNNRYRILEVLGQGGFGAVYRGADMTLKRPCAVKENLDTSEEAQRQFENEALILAKLAHSHLPRVIDHFFVPNQGQYLVMDFIDGEDVQTRIERDGPVSPDQALEWVSQIAGAVAYLHAQNPPIIHRDIKPANIRITPQNQAMLVDFGLVKIYDPKLRTTVGARAVTPGYSPPEQYGQGNTNTATDIYALGATLYNLLTGLEPQESVQRVIEDQLKPVHTVNPAVPPHVSHAIGFAMDLRPSGRYHSIAEFERSLGVPEATIPRKAIVAPEPNQEATQYVPPVKPPVVPPAPASSSQAKSTIPKWIFAIIGLMAIFGVIFIVVIASIINPGRVTSAEQTETAASELALAIADAQTETAQAEAQTSGEPEETEEITEETPLPPEDAAISPSATPTPVPPTNSPTPSPTPINTPAPVPALPAQVSTYLVNPNITYYESFDQGINPDIWKIGSDFLDTSGNEIAFTVSPGWKSLLVRKESINVGEGILLRFSIRPDARFLAMFRYGDWGEDDYLRWGIKIAPESFILSPDIYQGSYFFPGTEFKGETTMRVNTWYYLLMVVNGRSEFGTYFWAADTPSLASYYVRTNQNTWAGKQWEFQLLGYQSTIFVDSYAEITFDDIK